jgi:hypothetical protein
MLMTKFYVPLLCLMLGCAGLITPVASKAQASPYFVITHANVIDGVSATQVRDATILIRDEKIESIVTGNVNIPRGASVLDLKGRWLLPGFVDAHAHLSDLAAARRALASGATTVRCLGVNHFVDIGFRELSREGVRDIPDVVAAGYHVRPRPAEEFFVDLPKMNDLMSGIKVAPTGFAVLFGR